MPDRIALQPLVNQKIYFQAQVVRSTPRRGNIKIIRGTRHLCLEPVEINGRPLPQEPEGKKPMHLWVPLPTALIELSQSQSGSHPLSVRGFGIVLLYQREDGSFAYGLDHPRDLEVQCGAGAVWSVLQGSTPRYLPQPVTPRAAVPREVAHKQYETWMAFFQPMVSRMHMKIVTYRQRSDNPHYNAYCAVLKQAWKAVGLGHLPGAAEMNTVYYLMGQWPAAQAPRHLREAYP